jgi:NAD(P)-dependent dehydrogenase (short-subunit alcohol dehydrogenase family)
VTVAGELFAVAGQSALVTGATGAFGSMAARTLAAGGARLTIAGARSDRLEELAEEMQGAGGERVTIVARRPETENDVDALIDTAVRENGGIDVVVSASGMNRVAPTIQQPLEDWQAVMDANVRDSWLLCRSAGRRMIEQGRGGKIVLVSSTRGRLGHPAGYGAYCPSKAAIDTLTRTLACEWGAHRINVNAIAPTVFRSDLTAWMYSNEDPGRATREGMLARIPLGRLGEPDDFAGALLYFAAPASDFCTGQVLYVDGGYTAG